MNVKDRAKAFFRSKSAHLLMWLIIWGMEIYLLKWIMENHYFSAESITLIKIVAGVIIAFLLYYWFREKCTTELFIYSFGILEFMLFELYEPDVFLSLTGHPGWQVYAFLMLYTLLRIIVPWKSLLNIEKDVVTGWSEARKESLEESRKKYEQLEQERKEKKENKRQAREAKRAIRQARWRELGSNILTFLAWIFSIPKQIITGLSQSKSRYSAPDVADDGTGKKDKKETSGTLDEKFLYFLLSHLFVPLVFLLPFVIVILVIKDSSLLSDIAQGSESAEVVTQSAIKVFAAGAILVIALSVLVAMIANVAVHIHIFIIQMKKDLMSALKNENDRPITSNVLSVLTIGIIIYWLSRHYPFSIDDLAVELSNGRFIVYPLGWVILTIIISFFTNKITVNRLEELLKSENASQIVKDLFSIVMQVIGSAVSYLKIVTGDFLSSIKDLAHEDDLIDDLEEEEESK